MSASSQTPNEPTSPTLGSQTGPIGLLAYLHATMPGLPAVTVHLFAHARDELSISIQGNLNSFTAWRSALGLGAPVAAEHSDTAWVTASGEVADVPVKLTCFAPAAEIAAYLQPAAGTPAEVAAALTAMAATTAAAVQQQGGAA
ncbi:hypothetical protein ACWCWD_06600 [Streptomyces sp. NPDC001493]